MRDFHEWNEERRERFKKRAEHYNKHSRFWFGLLILLVGVVALLKISVPEMPKWVFSWQMLLIALGLFSGLKHNFRGGAWFILMLVGGVFLVSEINPEFSMRPYLWPIAIIAVGLYLIWRSQFRKSIWDKTDEKKNVGPAGVQDAKIVSESTDSPEDFVDSTSIFGGAKKNIISKNFRGGDLVSIFGGTEIDLTRADFQGTAVIELTTIFGGTKLIVPPNWSVRSEAVTIFGGLDDKRSMQSFTDSPDKVLLLKGTVLFGGIDIRSY